MIEDFRLKVFETVAELGSFTAAARKLGISQPAISNHINELEKQMQTKLVARSRAVVSLTENGRKFLSYVHQILHAPWEIIAKEDLLQAYAGYKAFLKI